MTSLLFALVLLAGPCPGPIPVLEEDRDAGTRPPEPATPFLPLPDLDGHLPRKRVRFALRYVVDESGRALESTCRVTRPRRLAAKSREHWPSWLELIASAQLAAAHRPGTLEGRPTCAWREVEFELPGRRDVERGRRRAPG